MEEEGWSGGLTEQQDEFQTFEDQIPDVLVRFCWSGFSPRTWFYRSVHYQVLVPDAISFLVQQNRSRVQMFPGTGTKWVVKLKR